MEIGTNYIENANGVKIQTPAQYLAIHGANVFQAGATIDCSIVENGVKKSLYAGLKLSLLAEHCAHEMGMMAVNSNAGAGIGHVMFIEIALLGAANLNANKYLEFNFNGMYAAASGFTFNVYAIENMELTDILTRYNEVSVNVNTANQKFENKGYEVALFPVSTALKEIVFTFENGQTSTKPLKQIEVEQILWNDKFIDDDGKVGFKNLYSFELKGVRELEVKTDKTGYNFIFVDNKY